MEVGETIPEFTVVDSNGNLFSKKDLLGMLTLLFFYPKDNTSGCTMQACSFRDHLEVFKKQGVRILGVNPAASHEKFINQHQLNFPILSDPEMELCRTFDVWKEKSMYGRTYMGVERSTFLLDTEGKIVWAERKVALPGHLERALQAIEEHIKGEDSYGIENRRQGAGL